MQNIFDVRKNINEETKEGKVKDVKDSIEESSSFFLSRALAYVKIHQYKNGIDDFIEAIALNINDDRAWFNRGLSYLLLGDEATGIMDIKIAAKMGTSDATNWLSLKGVNSRNRHPSKMEYTSP